VIVHRIAQRSPEWYALRCGKLTASSAADVLTVGKAGAEAVARRDLRLKLACERLTGIPEPGGFISDEMQRGIDKEADAVAAYEAKSGLLVDTSVGFMELERLTASLSGVTQSELVMAGYSPDGVVGDGLVECKCPKTSTHLGYLRDPGSLAKKYAAQAWHGLWVSGASWLDLVSFDDRLPSHLSLVVVRVLPEKVPDYALAATLFLNEVSAEVDALNALKEIA